MTQINAYLTFNGDCREAMTFYKECIGGELMMQTIGGSPIEAQCPPQMKDKILHSSLTNGGVVLMATDCVPGKYIQGNDVALTLHCSSEEEINSLYARLSEGGKIVDSLKPQFWGAISGVFTDKFGKGWVLNYDKNHK